MRNHLAWLTLWLLLGFTTALCQPSEQQSPLSISHLKSLPCVEPDSTSRFAPLGLGFGPRGELFVVDGEGGRIWRVSPDLSQMELLASCPHEESCRLIDIVATMSAIYVSESLEGSVLCFDTQGRFVEKVWMGEGLAGIDVTDEGWLYGVLSLEGTVKAISVYSDQDAIEISLGDDIQSYPVDCIVDSEGHLLVSDANGGRVEVLDGFGKHMGYFGEGELSNASGLAIYRDLYRLVSDTKQAVVKVFDRDGDLVEVFGRFLLSPTFIACREDGIVCVADSRLMTIEVFRIDEASD